jgi:hypothetical protein
MPKLVEVDDSGNVRSMTAHNTRFGAQCGSYGRVAGVERGPLCGWVRVALL